MEVLKCSIDAYNKHSLDFVDCILYAYNKIKHIKVINLGKKLNKLLDNNICCKG